MKNYFYLIVLVIFFSGCATSGKSISKEKEASAHYKLGLSYLNDNATQAAFLEFQKAINLNPDDKLSHYFLGYIYFQQQKNQPALKELEIAVKIDPEYSDAYNLIGNIYGTMREYDNAIKFYRKSLQNKLYETPQKGHYNIGLIYFEQAKYVEAAGEFQEAIHIDPAYVLAHWFRGEALLKSGNVKDAFISYEEAVHLAPDDPLLHLRLGEKYLERGADQKAETEFRKVIALNPDSNQAKEAKKHLERRR